MNNSHLYKIILLLAIVVLVVLYFNSATNTSNESEKETKVSTEISHQDNLNESKGDKSGHSTHDFHLNSVVSEEVKEFNLYLQDNVTSSGHSKKETVLSQLKDTVDENNVHQIAEELKEVKADFQKNQLLIRSLHLDCAALKNRESNILKDNVKSHFKAELFLLALQESKYCSDLGTNQDPFFTMVQLARKGDKLAQLWMLPDLNGAVMRGVVDPQLYPIEYEVLRNEALNYLKSFSARGVKQASIMLHDFYQSDKYL